MAFVSARIARLETFRRWLHRAVTRRLKRALMALGEMLCRWLSKPPPEVVLHSRVRLKGKIGCLLDRSSRAVTFSAQFLRHLSSTNILHIHLKPYLLFCVSESLVKLTVYFSRVSKASVDGSGGPYSGWTPVSRF